MNLFDLLFIALFLTTLCTLLAAGWFAGTRQFDRARRILQRLAWGAAAYMAIVISVSLVQPRQVLAVGEPLCFDDWCIAVTGVKRAADGGNVGYHADLRLSSRARRVSQREKNVVVYLADDRGRRYDSAAIASDIPISVLLRPQESVVVSRSFAVPANASRVGVVIAHEGGFPIGWFIIGYDTWFRKPPIVSIDSTRRKAWAGRGFN